MNSTEIFFQAKVDAPREKVFDYFADHQNFTGLFGSTCERSREGKSELNGLGSVRTMRMGIGSFDETIVLFDKPNRIHYRITRGSPLKDHLGTVEFVPEGDGTRVDYRICFKGKAPFVAPLVAWLLKKQWGRFAVPRLANLSRG
ncbi:MAG: SRPBCC family protein [Burkholderiales bacterium]